eukprot:13290270-Alexandrium_andersonii.AAC.1
MSGRPKPAQRRALPAAQPPPSASAAGSCSTGGPLGGAQGRATAECSCMIGWSQTAKARGPSGRHPRTTTTGQHH